MKKFFQNILEKLLKKAVNKAASDNDVEVSDVEPGTPGEEPAGDSKKAIWKFIIQTLISILTAILTALGATSCMGIH